MRQRHAAQIVNAIRMDLLNNVYVFVEQTRVVLVM